MLERPLSRSIARALGRGPEGPAPIGPMVAAVKLGPELIVNGDFSSSAGWTAGGGWSISGGAASAASGGSLSRGISVTAAKKYIVAFDMASRSAGNVQPQLSGGTTVGSEMFDTAGERRTIITAASGNATFAMKSNSGVLSIDNVSVKEILEGGYLTAMGDSLTSWVQFGLTADNYYPKLLQDVLPHVKAVNLGVSGNSTAQMVARLSSISNTPYIFIVYGGANDAAANTTVQASPAPTAATFSVAAGQGVRYGIGGKILVNGVQAEVQSIAADAITLTAPLDAVPVAGQVVKIDTAANIVKMGQHVQSMGCTRILVIGRHFDNWASGTGDTLAAPQAANAAIRAAQQSAADTLGAIYVDTYAWMRALIEDGTYAEGDDVAWHVGTGNLHLNSTGQQIITDAMLNRINYRGWGYA